MKKELEEKENKPIKRYTVQEARSFVLESTSVLVDPNELLGKFANEYMPVVFSCDDGRQKEISEKISELALAFSSETGFMLMKSVGEEYRSLALQMKRDLQEEFDCKTVSERMLVDLMVNSYIKKLRYSDKMEHNQKYIGHKYDSYRNYLSKEIDRSYRQFTSSLEILRFLRQPAIKVSIKTNNAFVGENQQFNTKVESNEAK